MSHELPKKVKIFADTAKSCERMSKKLEEAQDILDKAGEEVANAQADGKSGWVHLSAAIGALRKLMRPDPDTVPWHTEIDYYLDHEPRLRWDAAGEYRTPKEAIDFIMGNPPLGDLPPGLDGVEPRDTPISPDAPKMERGEDRYMSRPEAIYILGKLATSRRINVDGVIALQMGARSLMKRHFDRQRNWARRRERVAEDSKRTTASAEHEEEAQA